MARQFKPGQLQTGSLYNISSSFAITSSYATTASYAVSSSYAVNATTASYALTASHAHTASYVNPLHQNVIITGSLFVTQSHISTLDYIDFTTTANPSHQEGRFHWIDDTKTVQIDTDVNGFMIEVGHQNVVRFRNTTGGVLAAGKVVYIVGESGNRPTVATASWTGDPTSAATLGFVAQAVNDSQTGYIITNGLLRGINTNAYAPGTQLYLSSSGDYTSTVPVSPLHEVRLGKTITQATNGIIYVDIMNGYEIGELHDVLITNASNGDLILWNSGSGVWNNTKVLSGSYGISGSLTAPSITGSLLGTASYATTALTASYLSGYVSPFPYTGSAIISGSLTVTGSTNLQGSSGTTIFSSNADSLVITGSLLVTGSVSVVGLITGTASYATQTLSSSFASTAQTASYVLNAISASYASISLSSSFSTTSSFARTASYYNETDPIFVAKSASFATTSSNTFIGNQIISGSLTMANGQFITGSLLGTSSFSLTASYIDGGFY